MSENMAPNSGSDRSVLERGTRMFENRQLADLAVGRSTVRQRILALLMAEPGTRLHLRAIQRRAGTSPGTASRELAKLVSAGLVEREPEGSQVYFHASTSPLATTLRTLLMTAPAPPSDSSPSPVAGTGAALAPGISRPEAAPPPGETVTIGGSVRSGSEADPLGLEAGATAAAQMRSIYRERLRGIYLYGQRTSGVAPPDSEVDLLVVLDRIERYGEELDRTSTVCASLSLDLGVVVSRIFVSEADWRDRTDGQLPGVRAEAVAL
jgi:predicted nucleotidyltransferase/DNA-binding transcriptional ArsR family regulator